MLFLIGTFGLNFPIFNSTMAIDVFHADVRGYGLLSSIMAIGTVAARLASYISPGRVRLTFMLGILFGVNQRGHRRMPPVSAATRSSVAMICVPAFTVPRRLPATFESPAMRRRYGSGTSRTRRPARAARICISRFHP